ncbi:hypothetical protein D3C81_2234330 [compost metagenome]
MRQRNIKILDGEQDDFIVYHKILCRNYTEKFGLTRDVMRSEIRLRLTKYTSEVGVLLKGGVNVK